MRMNHAAIAITALVALTCLTPVALAQAPVGAAYTYQGQLMDGGSPASGSYNMVFKLFDAATLGNQVGPTLTFDGAGGNPPAISVTDGLFAVALDFGAVYDGDQRFLEVTVSGSTLTPRQELTATPYARFSAAPWATSGDNIFNVNSGNVGLGGATLPETRLHILSGSDVTSSSGGYIQMGATTAENIALDNNEVQARFNGAPATLALNYEGGEVNMCPNGGNVGIGTTVPRSKLHVNGNGNPLTLEGTDHAYMEWFPDGLAAGRKGYMGYEAPADDNFNIVNQINGAHILLRPTNGNVGIGTTTPAERLDLGGQADGTTLQIGAYTALGEGVSSGATVLGDNAKPANAPTDGLTFITSHASYGARAIEMRIDNGIVFHANSGVATADAPFSSEVMRITNAGNVGIGITSPAEKLDVAGTARMTGFKMTGGTPGTGKVLTSDASGVGSWLTPTGVSAVTASSPLSSSGGTTPNISLTGLVPVNRGGTGASTASAALSNLGGWSVIGNSGTTAGTNFLGTTDDEALEFKVNDQRGLRLEPNASLQSPNIIGGSGANQVTAGVGCGTISGGGFAGAANIVTDNGGTVGGGRSNQAGDNAGTVLDAQDATVAGGHDNAASETDATVGGGGNNTASAPGATVAGGQSNTASGDDAAIGGGRNNTAVWNATVAGGFSNDASGADSTVGGGNSNTASSTGATVCGGTGNTASGIDSAVAGGNDNEATGATSFAAGVHAKAIHGGAFVWGDNSTASDVASSTINQFTARSAGGVRFFTNSAMTLGAKLDANATAWSVISDRNVKHNVVAVDPRQVVEQLAAIPISTWTYIDDEHSTPHMGPMAQDFYAAFGLGADDKSISTLDADGVALAAIQGLHQLISEKDAQIAELNARVERLEIALNLLATASKESK